MSILVEMELIPSIGRKSRIAIGFTLAELLIALGILGVIATFTIPKVLSAQQETQKKAIAKEVASMITGAYQLYVKDNGYSTSISGASLVPYLNYVRIDTSNAWFDTSPSNGILMGALLINH